MTFLSEHGSGQASSTEAGVGLRIVGERTPTEGRLLDREVSWLDFNARVLALADDPALPLLERVKFLAIFSSNLDEFFQVRVPALLDEADAGVSPDDERDLAPVQQLALIRARVRDLVAHQASLLSDELVPALERHGIRITSVKDLDERDRAYVDRVFEQQMFPVLTPLAIDPGHPFPYISNLSLNLAVVVRDPLRGDRRYARVKLPPSLPRFIALPDGEHFLPLEQLVAVNLDRLFPGMEILSQHPFRVTRDVDIALSDESEDLLRAVESVLFQRTKFGRAVRLEVDAGMPTDVRDLLLRELELDHTYVIEGYLDLTGLWGLYALDRPELKDAPWRPRIPHALAHGSLFDAIRERDVLVHHPYDSFRGTVEAFLAEAADDPSVLAIKQTLYRTGGDEEGIVGSLARAARAGKQVVAVIELKARFDEQANIERARLLEQAGVHVVYGFVGLKTHAKLLMVVRQEADGLRRYCHVGTGNYNPKTANLYEDVGVFSSDDDLGADVTELFNHLTGYSRPRAYRRLLVAPERLRVGLAERIRAEAHPEGRIVFKVNALVDRALIDELYAAAAAGASIDLIVRGICCLRPGVAGRSENIRVRSVVGRYLEHSRLFRFGTAHDGETLIGSADLMPRNLDRRVEALLRVTDPAALRYLDTVLDVLLSDSRAWTLCPDGTWTQPTERAGASTHERLMAVALARDAIRGNDP